MKILITAFVLFFIIPAIGQDIGNDPDSLLSALNDSKEDTGRVNILIALANKTIDENPKKSHSYIMEAVQLAEQLNDKQLIATAYNTLGNYYSNISDFPKSLETFFKSLRINEELGNKVYVARNAGNIGNVYRALGEFHKAIEYFEKALVINTELDRGIGMTNNLSDMGIAYCELGEEPKAYESFNKALKIAEQKNDREGMAIILGNIANLDLIGKNYRGAIENFNRSMNINEEISRTPGIATNLVNLGDLHLAVAVDSTGLHQQLLISVGGKSHALDRAVQYYERALTLFDSLGSLNSLSMIYKGLSKAFIAKGDYRKALEMNNQYHLLKDSVFSIDNRLIVSNQSKERAELEMKQQEVLTGLVQKKRRNEAALFTICITLLLVFTGFVIKERKKSDKLLLNILPAAVANELKKKGNSEARQFNNVTVLFTDFVNFTTASERMSARELVSELHVCFKSFDEIISKYKIEKIKTIGDAYLAVSGLPKPDPQHAENVVQAALEICAFMRKRYAEAGEKTFQVRVGVHSGSLVAGIVGVKKFAYDIWGDTVNTAARMEQKSEPGKVNVSETTCRLVGDSYSCTYRGEIEAKNKGKMKMFFIDGRK
jgi:adenylate cyclase